LSRIFPLAQKQRALQSDEYKEYPVQVGHVC
jgi:hypothetical protein